MTYSEALGIRKRFLSCPFLAENDASLYEAALRFLTENTADPQFMVDLAAYYNREKDFSMALKYYEMAAARNAPAAWAGLGYIYYYGRTGSADYEKAFRYYSLAMDAGDLQCTYKIADMYKNGYYVQKNQQTYQKIIEGLYPQICNATDPDVPLPEIYLRLAQIRAANHRQEDALRLYTQARSFLARRIQRNPYFGNLSVMKQLIREIYGLTPFDRQNFSLYDLYWLLTSPVCVSFRFEDKTYTVEAMGEKGICVIRFGDTWYRTTDDFFAQAAIGGSLLVTIENRLHHFHANEDDPSRQIHLFDTGFNMSLLPEDPGFPDALTAGDHLSLVRQADNTLLVQCRDGETLGSIEMADQPLLLRLLDAGKLLGARVKGLDPAASVPRLHIGIYLIDF